MTKNIAHRGFSASYPENTLLAFQKALDAGCDGIELDVHLTRDKKIVVIHDESVERTTDGSGFVKDMTLDELCALDAGQGEQIPTLEKYLDLVEQAGIISNIELKNSVFRYPGMEEIVIQAIRERGISQKVILSSFNHYSILECKRIAPEIRCGFLTDSWIVNAGAYTKSHGVECLHPEYRNLTDEIVGEIHANGVAINTYTVDDAQAMARLSALGVAGVITNNPALLKEVLTGAL